MDSATQRISEGEETAECPFHNIDWAMILPWKDLFVVLIAVLVVTSASYVYSWWLQRNRPGPKSWPVVGSVPLLINNWDRLHDYQLEFFERGHDVIWMPLTLGLDGVYIAEPSLVEYVLKTNFSNYPKGKVVRTHMEELLGTGIFNTDHDQWKVQRKVASLEFAPSKLRHHNAAVYRNGAVTLLGLISDSSRSRQVVDLQDLFMRMTLDSTGKLGFGVELGCLSSTLPAVPFATAFDRANELSYHRYIDPLWNLKRVLNIGKEKELKECLRVMDSFSYDVIKKRRNEMIEESETSQDLLSRFMSFEMQKNEVYSDQVLRDVVLNFIIAGRDTSALTLSWFIYRLCLHPEVADKVLEEVKTLEHNNDTLNEEKSRDDYERFAELLTSENLEKLHYLQAALSETLRLHPPVPVDGKSAVADDVLPDGTKVKKGNMVAYCAYSMGRLKRVWGPDAKEFRPERWLKDGIFQPESPFKFVSFHAGPRACVGKDSAYLQMKMTIALLLRFFRFQLVPDHEVTYRVMFVLAMSKGLKVIASRVE